MENKSLEFWFEFASTYTYPTAMRIEARARAAGVAVVWKPFLLGPIFQAQGWNDSPFNIYEAKGRYMWRDLARICEALELPLQRPSRFPRNGLLAARVASVGAGESWGAAFVRGVYHANFAEDAEISQPEVIAALLTSAGADAKAVMERAQSDDNKLAVRRLTEEAARRGVFGSPSFLVGDELFWGNDRLEDALAWARR